MSNKLNFEFDFDEVFEGIRLGIIKELSETNFDEIKSTALSQLNLDIKNNVDIKYDEIIEMKKEIKENIVEKVYNKIFNELNKTFEAKFEKIINDNLVKNFDSIAHIENKAINIVVKKVEKKVFDEVEATISKKMKEVVQNIDISFGKQNMKLDDDTIISKEKYNTLIKRSNLLTALENGGVDNWEWYGEAIKAYEDEYGELDE